MAKAKETLKDFKGKQLMVVDMDTSSLLLQEVTTGYMGLDGTRLYMITAEGDQFDVTYLRIHALKPEELT